MNSLLEKILLNKRYEIRYIKANGERNRKIYHLKDYLKKDSVNIIAEIKSRSPSAGFLRNIDLDEILPVYGRYASAVSVLTDEKFFGGSFNLLKKIADAIKLPVLCKDFIINEVQIDKAYECGADIVLLIVRILNDEALNNLYRYAKKLGLDVFVEVHSLSELERVKFLMPKIVGVNSRDLDTLEISLERVGDILDSMDFETIKIAESGIKTKDDVNFLKNRCDGFLIGEALMKHGDNLEDRFLSLL